MLARSRYCLLVALIAGHPLSSIELRGDDTPEATVEPVQQNATNQWQLHVQAPTPNTFVWQQHAPDAWRHNGARLTLQPPQPTRQLWNVTAVTYSNPLGVEVAPAEAALLSQLGMGENKHGVIVTSVLKESEAEKSGLKVHDLILQIGDVDIANPQAINEAVKRHQGQDVQLHIVRQGKEVKLPIEIPKPEMFKLAEKHFSEILNVEPFGERYQIGVALAEADDVLRSQLRIDAGEGLVVTKVIPDTPAADAELREHDILIELDGRRIHDIGELNDQVQKIKDRKVALKLLRAGEELRVQLTPQMRNEPNPTLDFLIPVQPQGAGHVPPATLYAYNYLSTQLGDAADVDVPKQIAKLRRQVSEMQQSLQRLEETLRASEKDAPDVEPADKE